MKKEKIVEMKREKCPHCGQMMPLTKEQKKTRMKIKRGSLAVSEYHMGAFAWFDREEGEGGAVGQSYNEKTEEEMLAIIRGDKVDEVYDREYWAVELAAILVAREQREEYGKNECCWIWKKTKLNTLISRAESLMNGDE